MILLNFAGQQRSVSLNTNKNNTSFGDRSFEAESPTAREIRDAANTIMSSKHYKESIIRISEGFRRYDANKRCADYIECLLQKTVSLRHK